MKKTLKGFTLIEMLIVIVIIGILAAVLIPKIGGAREKAEDVAIKANVRSYAQGILQMQLDNTGKNVTSFDALNTASNSSKYGTPYLTEGTGDYSFNGTGSDTFIICGKVKDGGNSASGASNLTPGSFTEGGGTGYYCYQG